MEEVVNGPPADEGGLVRLMKRLPTARSGRGVGGAGGGTMQRTQTRDDDDPPVLTLPKSGVVTVPLSASPPASVGLVSRAAQSTPRGASTTSGSTQNPGFEIREHHPEWIWARS